MTRILVCGMGEDDFVNRSLDEVNRVYGPVSCVIHNNHPQALAWQQEVSEVQVTRHLPLSEDWRRDGHLAGSRCRDRMFDAKPNYLVVFATTLSAEERKAKVTDEDRRTQYMIHRAQADGIQVLTFTDVVRAKRRNRAKPEQVMIA